MRTSSRSIGDTAPQCPHFGHWSRLMKAAAAATAAVRKRSGAPVERRWFGLKLPKRHGGRDLCSCLAVSFFPRSLQEALIYVSACACSEGVEGDFALLSVSLPPWLELGRALVGQVNGIGARVARLALGDRRRLPL